MTSTSQERELTAGRQVGTAIHMLMWEKRISQVQMGKAIGKAGTVLGKKLRGEVPITIDELMTIAQVLDVDPGDLLPNMERARRDSNPKPSDMERGALHLVAVAGGLSVRPTLTLNRQTATHHPSCPARDGSGACIGCGRHLSVVA